jgi:hypothetical protein
MAACARVARRWWSASHRRKAPQAFDDLAQGRNARGVIVFD